MPSKKNSDRHSYADMTENSGLVPLNTTDAMSLTTTKHPLCSAPDDFKLVERFWLCVVVGVTVSTMSILFNSFIFVVFSLNRQHRKSPNLYLLLLSMFDVFIAFAYIAVLSVRVLTNFTASVLLKSIWVKYMVPMLAVSHIGITSSTFLICFVSIERYCITVNNFLVPHLQRHRPFLAFLAVMCGVVSKGTILKEVTINTDEDCAGELNYWRVEPSQLVLRNPNFNIYWRFYFRNIFTILAPFFILLLVNCLLLYRLQEHVKKSKYIEQSDKQVVKMKKARIRAATRSLVIIICTYLFSNVLSVIITIWEYIDSASLFAERYQSFYVLSVDVISILTIVASCLRLPIYAICQPLLRKEMNECLLRFCGCGGGEMRKKKMEVVVEAKPLQSSQLINPIDSDSTSVGSRIEFV
ncbi:unnamed protein product [Caenorhabditis bovis]|uniref:G-protein coupled receptors family 1 profile domain-containing protein n=1 Tax=Caenorhabditis bovis TaxID=2654633 RepID=A0A8S1EDA3_9PELO|nr:unnamed protein product [Caenorhabditis bovis]